MAYIILTRIVATSCESKTIRLELDQEKHESEEDSRPRPGTEWELQHGPPGQWRTFSFCYSVFCVSVFPALIKEQKMFHTHF